MKYLFTILTFIYFGAGLILGLYIKGVCTGSPWTRALFLKSPNLTGPKSDFEIKVSRKVECVLASNEVHFVSLVNTFTV